MATKSTFAGESSAEGRLHLYSYIKGDCSEVGISLFSQVTIEQEIISSSSARGVSGWMLGSFFSGRVVRYWNRLQSPSLEVFQKHVNVALRIWFGGDGLIIELNDLPGLFQP